MNLLKIVWNEQSATFKKAELFCSAFWLEKRIIMPDLNNKTQGFGVDLNKQVVDIEN